MTLWSCDLARSREKIKPLYLHYHNIYGHQTSKDGDISWQAPNHKVIQGFDHVVLQGHAANKNHDISITRVSMTTKLCRKIAFLDGLLPVMLHDPLIIWPCEIWGSLTGGRSARKRLSRHWLLVYVLIFIWD